MDWILGLQNFPTMSYIAVSPLTRRIHIFKKNFVLFWMGSDMFVEAAFLNKILRHIFRPKHYQVYLVRFLYSDFLLRLA